MNLILDTHAFLWYISGDKQLPVKIVRMIIAQTKTTGSTLISKDKHFKSYNIEVLW
jgi:PIN domain nuclease of toxin-antitoxin system